jgi:AcrR family transcriptional regulator
VEQKPKKRGQYAKGELRREEILDRAVEAFGRLGYHATSMREIASTCGLSQAGLLHYYPNKEALLLALVQRREAETNIGTSSNDWVTEILRQVEQNENEKALTQLWANLVGEATDPEFPAHTYFVSRYVETRASLSAQFAKNNGRDKPNQEDQMKGSLLAAMWDGLQTQWLLDPSFDMKETFKYGMSLLTDETK